MISEIIGIRNTGVVVMYDFELKTVTVTCMRGGAWRCFAEFADMHELFNTFKANMTDETDYGSAIQFFKPNVSEWNR